MKKMYQYYKGTIDLWLTYGGGEKQPLTGYSDADGSMGEDRRVILGYTFLSMAVPFLGLLKDRKSSPYPPPSPNI